MQPDNPFAPGPVPGPSHGPSVGSSPAATPDERTYATFVHVIPLGLHVIGGTVAFIPLVVALVLWLIKREQSRFIDDHAKEALNFQISLLIYTLAGAVIFGFFMLITCGIGTIIAVPLAVVLALAVWIIGIVGGIKGAIAANKGDFFRYPICLRLVA